jgi:hypothetical protein
MVVAAGILLITNLAVAIDGSASPLALAVDVLAAYTLLDAGAAFLLSIMVPARRQNRGALFTQAAAALVFGTAYYLRPAEVICFDDSPAA